MPGPQDRWDQQPGSGQGRPGVAAPDSPRREDLPARGSDLPQRLERLPPGHPSSPYNDDGTRKPPVPQLRHLELPVPGEERDGTAAPIPDGRGRGQPGSAAELNGSAAPGGGADTAPAATAGEELVHAASVTAGRYAPEAARDRVADRPARPAGQPTAAATTDRLAALPAADEPSSGAHGSWDWKGLHLTPAQSRIAEHVLSQCRTAEGRSVFGVYGERRLTPTMRQIEAGLEHGRLVPDTEKFVLKSAERFKEKLAKMIADEPGADPAALAAGIHDGVRYTFLLDEPNYARGFVQARSALESQRNELLTVRNTWTSDESKGVTTRWRQRDSGQLFEVQFHTHQSWAAKQQTHRAYEAIASRATPAADRERLRAYQREVCASVPVPPGSSMIADYRKRG
jgi:hypothetical protein